MFIFSKVNNKHYTSLYIHPNKEKLSDFLVRISKARWMDNLIYLLNRIRTHSIPSYRFVTLPWFFLTSSLFLQRFSKYLLFYFRCSQVMQKSCRCTFMYGELTDKETIARIDECLENQLHDQFEILLYKKNSKSFLFFSLPSSLFLRRQINRILKLLSFKCRVSFFFFNLPGKFRTVSLSSVGRS